MMIRLPKFLAAMVAALTFLSSAVAIAAIEPPVLALSFGGATVPLNGVTPITYYFLSLNPAGSGAITGLGFTHNLPAGMVVASPAEAPGPNTKTCNNGGVTGTLTANAGATQVTLSGASVADGDDPNYGTCVYVVYLKATTVTTKNVSLQASSAAGNSLYYDGQNVLDQPSTASVQVLGPPTLAKAFGAPSILLNGTTTVTFTLTNPNNVVLDTILFADYMVDGLIVATPPGVVNTCNGVVNAGPGNPPALAPIQLTGGSIPAGASCSLRVNVKGTSPGAKHNTTTQISSGNGGVGAAASADLLVIAPPVLAMSFGGPTVPLNGITSLTFVLLNLNETTQNTGVNFTANLPPGLVIAGPADSPPPDTNACNKSGSAGTLTAVAGSSTITYTGATIDSGIAPDSGNCVITVSVKGTSVGPKPLSVRAHSNQGDSYAFQNDSLTLGPSIANVLVVGPATLTKAFGAPSIVLNHTTTLTFTLSNANTVPLVDVLFGDYLVEGLVVASPNGLINNCGGTVTADAGSPPAIAPIQLTGGTIPANGSCTITVTVKGTSPQIKHNTTTPTSTSNGGIGLPALADLLVIAPPVAFKQFFDPDNPNDPTTPLNGQAALVLVLLNVNETVPLTAAGFTDTLPAGLVMADPPTPADPPTCDNGGVAGTVTATAGAGSFTYSGATIAPAVPGSGPSTCQIIVFVTGTQPGDKTNTFNATAAETGAGESASASILVVAPPTVTKSFDSAFTPASLALNESTTLRFTLSNSNRVDLINVGIGDTLPEGLVVTTPSGAVNNCGGTLTATDGTSDILLSGATVPANGSCTFSVDVTGTTAGTKDNTTTAPSSSNGGNGSPASATLYVVAPPVITKTFGAPSILFGEQTTLTITIVNPPENTIPLTAVGFSDLLPPELLIASPNGLVGSCGGGTIIATAITRVLALGGATIPVNDSCTFTIDVLGTNPDGPAVNLTSPVTSDNGGDGNTATATVAVVPRIIPTLQEWALVLLAALLALSALVVLRRHGNHGRR